MPLAHVRHQGLVGGYFPLKNRSDLSPQQALALANLRIDDGVLRPRSGITQFADRASTRRVLDLFNFVKQDNHYIIRFDQDKVEYWLSGSNAWSDISGTETWVGDDNDHFVAADWFDTMYFSNGIAATGTQTYGLYKWSGAGNVTGVTDTSATAITVPPCKAIQAGYLDRVWLGNTIEGGVNYTQRIRYCQRGDDTNWADSGAGYLEVPTDPYPIVALSAASGRIIAYKGDAKAGSIAIGVQTGFATTPVRFDTFNPESGIGLYAPRTLVSVQGVFDIFLGHDEVYVFDGASLRPIGGPIGREIITGINRQYTREAWALYKPKTMEYELYVPMSSGTDLPTKRYVYHIDTNRWSGPEDCSLVCGARFVRFITETWDSVVGAWNDKAETWDDLTSSTGEVITVYGDADGYTWQEDEAVTSDNGTSFTNRYQSGVLTFEGAQAVGKDATVRTKVMERDDYKYIASVTIVWRDVEAWTPTVRISTDEGLSWTTISDGYERGSGSDKTVRTTFGYGRSIQKIMLDIQWTGKAQVEDVEYDIAYAGEPQY